MLTFWSHIMAVCNIYRLGNYSRLLWTLDAEKNLNAGTEQID